MLLADSAAEEEQTLDFDPKFVDDLFGPDGKDIQDLESKYFVCDFRKKGTFQSF